MNIEKALKVSAQKLKNRNIISASLDAEILLLEAINKNSKTKKDKSWLYINNNYLLNEKEYKLFSRFINERKKHKPVAYIINRKEFYGYDFYVDKEVLIPRPETEFITQEALKIISNKENMRGDGFDLIDVGAGSGCIIISILNELRKNNRDQLVKNAFAIDISEKAISIAKKNSNNYGLYKRIKFIKGDIKTLGKINFNKSRHIIITANLPYIKDSDYKYLPKNVKQFEPKIALCGGKDGLHYIKGLIAKMPQIKNKTKKRFFSIVEADPSQINIIKTIAKKELKNVRTNIIKDLNRKKRIIIIEMQAAGTGRDLSL